MFGEIIGNQITGNAFPPVGLCFNRFLSGGDEVFDGATALDVSDYAEDIAALTDYTILAFCKNTVPAAVQTLFLLSDADGTDYITLANRTVGAGEYRYYTQLRVNNVPKIVIYDDTPAVEFPTNTQVAFVINGHAAGNTVYHNGTAVLDAEYGTGDTDTNASLAQLQDMDTDPEMFIGSANGANYWVGEIYQVSIWTPRLSDNVIQNLIRQGPVNYGSISP